MVQGTIEINHAKHATSVVTAYNTVFSFCFGGLLFTSNIGLLKNISHLLLNPHGGPVV